MVYTISTAFAIYFVIWWIALFLTLPFGVRSQHEDGEGAPGTDPGAPILAKMGSKLIWTTIISAVIFAVSMWAYYQGYFNIERLAKTERNGEILRITLAVAGFRRDELDVSVEDNQLVIRGRQIEEQTRTFLYRGIAARQFQKVFVLADGIEVLGADLTDGLLSIDLTRPLAGRPGKKVEISGRPSV